MSTLARPRRAALLCCHFTRNLAYYRAGWEKGSYIFPENELWTTLNSNFLDVAVLEWCKLFADSNGFYSWSKVVVDPKSFLPQLYHDYGASIEEWDRYIIEMRTYRNKFLAHLDKRSTMYIPSMDLAKFAIYYIYDTMRAEQVPEVFKNLPQDLRQYSSDCSANAAELYAKVAEIMYP